MTLQIYIAVFFIWSALTMAAAWQVTYISDCSVHYEFQAREASDENLAAACERAAEHSIKDICASSPLSPPHIRARYRAAQYLAEHHRRGGGTDMAGAREAALAALSQAAREVRHLNPEVAAKTGAMLVQAAMAGWTADYSTRTSLSAS